MIARRSNQVVPVQWRCTGFSLVEMILAIVIAAIVASGILAYTQGLLRGSSEPLVAAQVLSVNKQDMESLVAVYNRYVRGEIAWNVFFNHILALETNGVITGRVDLTAAGQVFAGSPFAVIQVTVGEGSGTLSAVFGQ